jgi:hypothetical protein
MTTPVLDRYTEPRSALNERLITWCLLVPLLANLTCLALAITVSPYWLILMATLWMFIPYTMAIGFLFRNWPTGIRMDEAGVTIGAIRSRRALRRRPTVYHQSWGAYTCPWPRVYDARVVTDPDEIKALRRRYQTLNNQWGGNRKMTHCDIGVMLAPFTRAVLVAEVWPPEITGTRVRPGRGYSNFFDGQLSHTFVPRMSQTWIVPTRHPEAVEEALKRYRQASRTAPRSQEADGNDEAV